MGSIPAWPRNFHNLLGQPQRRRIERDRGKGRGGGGCGGWGEGGNTQEENKEVGSVKPADPGRGILKEKKVPKTTPRFIM